MKLPAHFRSHASFTLIEMLVAMVVLSILVLVIFQITELTLQLTDTTGRSADSSIEARQILDRIGADIAGMVIRPDVDQFYYSGDETANPGENDKIFFYSQQTGYFNSSANPYYATNQSPVSLVGYRINTTDNPSGQPSLERLARGLTPGPDESGGSYGGPFTGPMQFLSFPVATSPIISPAAIGGAITNSWGANENNTMSGGGAQGDVGSAGGKFDDGSSPFYHVVGSDVFRFEVCFQIQNGTALPTYSLYPGYTNSAPVYPASITNTLAIVVAIAVLDSKSRNLVPAASWKNMITGLKNPTTANLTANPPVLMGSLWNSELPGLATAAGIPVVAASHIKVYQRCYYLNVPKAQ